MSHIDDRIIEFEEGISKKRRFRPKAFFKKKNNKGKYKKLIEMIWMNLKFSKCEKEERFELYRALQR